MSKNRHLPNGARFIEPDAYPQILSKPAAARALRTLRSAETAAKAQVSLWGGWERPQGGFLYRLLHQFEAGCTESSILFRRKLRTRTFVLLMSHACRSHRTSPPPRSPSSR